MTEDELLKNKLNAETGKISWQELQRHFARGVVIKVDAAADLVAVAVHFVQDDNDSVARLLNTGEVSKASDTDASDWQARNPVFWAVVVAPWVLVQEIQ